ncbi:MAG: hypothetical protein EG824_00130 [Deltaproteobacteria bacterium]|nr:hypothetical protein [Deltaproteobacteria bacterium]
MPPVGREWGAPHAEILWALDTVAARLRGTPLELAESGGQWQLSWCGQEVAQWRVSETNWDTLRAAVVATGHQKALELWYGAAPGA